MTDGRLTKIGDISAPDGRAEGMVILAETKVAVEILVIFDGMKNGAPTPLKLIKPRAP